MNSEIIHNNSMKHIFPNKFETVKPIQVVATKTILNVVKYCVVAFFVGSLLEYIMPKDENKDAFFLTLEVFLQVSIIIFSFMYLTSFGGARLGLLSFMIVIVASQPSLNLKINTIRKKLFKIENPKESYKSSQPILEKVVTPVIKKKIPVVQTVDIFDNEEDDEMTTALADLPMI
jgi:hypothetical protein